VSSKKLVADEPVVIGEVEGYPDEPVYEIIDGVVSKLPMSIQNDFLANRLLIELGTSVRSSNFGMVVHKMLFDLPLPGRVRRRRPDIAFVSFSRWPAERPIPADLNYWPVVPDLAVDFVSPAEEIRDSMDKLRDYFEAGVRQAWLVHPSPRVVQVFQSKTSVRVLREPEEIDGGDILPGIRIPVAAMLPA
jgi:Uma2 family endonuclease